MQNQNSDNILVINLTAIVQNYKILQQQASGQVAAVVKADAYGLGARQVAPVLSAAGCEKFFVATLDEAVALRDILPDAFIAVFAGLRAGQEDVFASNDLVPVLNCQEQLELWRGNDAPCIVHIDTGMNRLGFNFGDLDKINLDGLNVEYVMSHLACADTPEHKKNSEQIEKVHVIRDKFPKIKFSLLNSSGLFLGGDFACDMARPGCALYGVNPTPAVENPMQNVVSLKSKILQIRQIDSAATVGYGASCDVKKGAKIAVLPVGYADGYFRNLGNKSYCFMAGEKVPVVGRVSMDLITIDISSIEGVKIGDEVEIIGDNITVNDLAGWAGTIGYEVLTSLGARFKRVYL